MKSNVFINLYKFLGIHINEKHLQGKLILWKYLFFYNPIYFFSMNCEEKKEKRNRIPKNSLNMSKLYLKKLLSLVLK